MGKQYVKTIDGRQYVYERTGAERKGGKVVTRDKYIRPVETRARQSKLDALSPTARGALEMLWENGMPVDELQRILKEPKWGGIRVSATTLRNYMKQHGIERSDPGRRVSISEMKRRGLL